jgi:hypothetical protein
MHAVAPEPETTELGTVEEIEPSAKPAPEDSAVADAPSAAEASLAAEPSAAADAAPLKEGATDEAAAEGGDEDAPSEIDQWTPFTATDGRRMRVSCTLEPVIQLASSAPIGYRLARRVLELPSERVLSLQEQNNLSRADIGKIDFATIARGLDRLSAEKGESALPCLVLPISCVTLSNYSARNTLAGLLKKAKDVVRHGLICEVCDIEGVPLGTLQTAIQVIRPFCLRVVGRLREPPSFAVRQLKGGGLDGLSIECPEHATDPEFVGFTRNLIQVCRSVSKTVFLFQVAGIRHAAIAAQLGITHATVAAGRSMVRQAPVEAAEDPEAASA